MLRSTVLHTSHQPHKHAAASRDTASSTRAEYSNQLGVEAASGATVDITAVNSTAQHSTKVQTDTRRPPSTMQWECATRLQCCGWLWEPATKPREWKRGCCSGNGVIAQSMQSVAESMQTH